MIKDIIHKRGLKRLVLINSGVADYVEIEPSSSTHLASENNIGKTSILSTLQFLLIDDWRRMTFPKKQPDTEAFYFPSRTSMIIFEVQDQEGTEHLIVFRGNGLANNKRYSRWMISGHYELELFISVKGEGNFEPLEWEQVIENASSKGRRIDEFKNANELRKKLRSNPRWFPTREGVSHNNFITVLRTLNTLGEVKEKTLKQVLLDLNENLEISMDFAKEFGPQWWGYQERRKAHLIIDGRSTEIMKAKEMFDSESDYHAKVKTLLMDIGPRVESLNSRTQDLEEKSQIEISTLKENINQLRSSVGEIETKIGKMTLARGGLTQKIETLSIEESWASAQTEEGLNGVDQEAEDAYFDLKNRVNDATLEEYESSNRLKTKIHSLEIEQESYTKASEDKQSTLLANVNEQNLRVMPDPWKVLNPQLLIQQGRISNSEDAKQLLKEISASFKESSVSFRGLDIDDISNVDGAELFDDPEEILRKLKECEKALRGLRTRLRDVENYESILAERDKARKIRDNAAKDLIRFKKWIEESLETLSDARAQVKQLSEQEDKLKIEKEEYSGKLQASRAELEVAQRNLESIQERRDQILKDWEELQTEYLPNKAFNPSEAFSLDHLDQLKDDLFRATQLHKKHYHSKRRLAEYREQLYDLTPHIRNPSRDTFFPMLFERYQNIDLERETLEKEWIHLATNMSSKASNLKGSLNQLRQEVHEINHTFKQTNVSNLDEFSVEFIEHSSDVSLIENISTLTSFSPFTMDEREQEAVESLGRAVTNRSSINIADLFKLRFRVKTKDSNESELIENIDYSGSTGTIIIIKAVLLMILLKKTLAGKKTRMSIPIYIDEVGTLGSKNYRQILEVAEDLGFQIFTASPKSVETADVVYPLLGGRPKDRLYVTPNYSRPRPAVLEEEE